MALADHDEIDHSAKAPPFPPEAVRRYRAAGLWEELTLAEQFHAAAVRHADRPAVVASEGRLSYHDLDRRTDLLAAGLHAAGLRPGDPVLFQVTNRLHTILAWYGVLKAGLVPVATLALHRRHELGQIAARTGARAHLVEVDPEDRFDLVALADELRRDAPAPRHVITAGAAEDRPGCLRLEDLGADTDPAEARRLVERIQDRLDPDGVAVFQLSGGTTGVPKVIPRRHAEYWYNAAAYARCLGWDASSRVGHIIPIIHNAGIVCGLHAAHGVGARLILGSPNPGRSLPLLAREGVTDLVIGHGHFQDVADQGMGALAPTLKRAILSGAKIPPRLIEHIERLGVWPGQLFGMAEGFFAVTGPGTPREARAQTVGEKLSPLDEFVILEPGTENPVPDGVTGELCCRGPYTIPGYYDAPSHNAGAFTSDGFYRTGDLASVRVFGGRRCLSIDGRIKDLINRGGEKINAEEVELLLLHHPGIAEAALVAMPDPRLGERACAFLVPAGPELTMEQVQHHLDGLGVAKYKWPERLVWVPELPRSNVNKIDKKTLRSWARNR
ncbi:(2,3-dihydroxybenzoyl)adenylate synthase [Actinomadura madurae]|uniref:Non-ribosomal peptide synthetase component E (Peptide arylation enzyme) n=1 Tax=Actinomadura madurae TaxID=1993 RepID=A0A1I5GJQ4_9ACTN|nr:AMP-binding protein [Actinomadura madurae]SFO36099.1 Non-ribosomal peptide synthetase component E (peptide arylation enzyme) [Actinomadura madurae]SPT51353.1 Triostin synthetase I [Actinomadura madurae]